jgi:branched-chain amino acid transport system ATP-binding protein
MTLLQTPLLQTQGLTRQYGGIHAVNDVSFALERGEIRGVIGPNGAGKTTLVGMICGRVLPSAGTVAFDGADITRLQPWDRVARGIVYTFQITSVFKRLSCRANVALAAQRRLTTTLGRRFALSQAALDAAVDEALASVGLTGEAERIAGELPYGHQRLLEIAMGLALKPSLLILDEPTQGLAPGDIAPFCDLIRQTAKTTTILFIEHNLKVVLELADRVTVMDRGAILAEGTPAEIEQHPAVQQAYLGD